MQISSKSIKLVGSNYELTNNNVKTHFKALGLYNFRRGFGWDYKRGEGGLISGINIMFCKDEIKRI